MESVIDGLEKEHRLIQETMKELFGAKQECPADSETLGRLERLILKHVSREDTEIYIPLKRIEKLSSQAARFLEVSRRDLEGVKIFALIFFEKFRGEKSKILCQGFYDDLRRLEEKINKRIVMEDKELFPFLVNLWKNI